MHIVGDSTLAASQCTGGMVGGIGMALMERTVLDPRDGRPVNAHMADYLVPANLDIPRLEAHFVEEDDPHVNPLGVTLFEILPRCCSSPRACQPSPVVDRSADERNQTAVDLEVSGASRSCAAVVDDSCRRCRQATCHRPYRTRSTRVAVALCAIEHHLRGLVGIHKRDGADRLERTGVLHLDGEVRNIPL
jgi:hypothetical protein